MISFKEANFLMSTPNKDHPKIILGDKQIPEICFIGRSNCGKSSLINSLTNRKKLAKTSSTPGKTQDLVFFKIDNKLMLTDLPGYGFAKRSKKTKKKWREMINHYLTTRESLFCIFHLLDSRHLPSALDIEFIQSIQGLNLPILFILTKIDKVKKSKRTHHVAQIIRVIKETTGDNKADHIIYSTKENIGRQQLIQDINQRVLDWDY